MILSQRQALRISVDGGGGTEDERVTPHSPWLPEDGDPATLLS